MPGCDYLWCHRAAMGELAEVVSDVVQTPKVGSLVREEGVGSRKNIVREADDTFVGNASIFGVAGDLSH